MQNHMVSEMLRTYMVKAHIGGHAPTALLTSLDAVTALIEDRLPGAEWVLQGDDLSGLSWLDKSIPRPTDAAITAYADAHPVEQP